MRTIALVTLVVVSMHKASAQDNEAELIVQLKEALNRLASYEERISQLETDPLSIPSGAVIVFDHPSGCPEEDWTDMGETWRGRSIVAAVGNADDTYGFGRTGGFETHKLLPNEIPSHFHGIAGQTDIEAGGQNALLVRGSAGTIPHAGTLPFGGSEPHNNMPPYVALYFCKKG